MSKKVVLKLDLHDDKHKQKAMKSVSKIHGIDSIGMDMKEKKLTVIGMIDPVDVVNKLRKFWHTDIVSVGPAKEPEKKKEDNKSDPKKDAVKKEGGGDGKKEGGGGGGGGGGKKEGGGGGDKKKEKDSPAHHDPIAELVAYRGYNPQMIAAYNPHMNTAYNPHMNTAYNPHMTTHYCVHSTMEENPNACVIC